MRKQPSFVLVSIQRDMNPTSLINANAADETLEYESPTRNSVSITIAEKRRRGWEWKLEGIK